MEPMAWPMKLLTLGGQELSLEVTSEMTVRELKELAAPELASEGGEERSSFIPLLGFVFLTFYSYSIQIVYAMPLLTNHTEEIAELLVMQL